MSHWGKWAERHSVYDAPLRPPSSSVRAMQQVASAAPEGKALLLGVTPELAVAFSPLLAVDKNPDMIARVWPGDAATHAAVCADWLEIDLPAHGFAVVAGDGSLNNIPSLADIRRLLTRSLDWLVPGGVFVCRLFERPERPFTEDDILAAGRAPGPLNFHALKWMIAMEIAEERGAIVPVEAIRSRFEALFPDRDRMARETGWPRAAIDTIDVYRGSALAYSFPSRREFRSVLPEAAVAPSFHDGEGYPLAACCPIMSFAAPAR